MQATFKIRILRCEPADSESTSGQARDRGRGGAAGEEEEDDAAQGKQKTGQSRRTRRSVRACRQKVATYAESPIDKDLCGEGGEAEQPPPPTPRADEETLTRAPERRVLFQSPTVSDVRTVGHGESETEQGVRGKEHSSKARSGVAPGAHGAGSVTRRDKRNVDAFGLVSGCDHPPATSFEASRREEAGRAAARGHGGGGSEHGIVLESEGAMPNGGRGGGERGVRDAVRRSDQGGCDSELVLASSTPRSPAVDTDSDSGWEEACSQLAGGVQGREPNTAGSSLPSSTPRTPVSGRRAQTYSGDTLSRSLLTSPTTTRSFSSTRTFSSSLSLADSLGASPTIPEAVTPSHGAPRSALRGSALRGRFSTPAAAPKKISFSLPTAVCGEGESGGGGGGGGGQGWRDGDGDDDWLSDAQAAAAVLATPRTPKGSRGVSCQLSDDGFKTAVKPGAAAQKMGFVTPVSSRTSSRTGLFVCCLCMA